MFYCQFSVFLLNVFLKICKLLNYFVSVLDNYNVINTSMFCFDWINNVLSNSFNLLINHLTSSNISWLNLWAICKDANFNVQSPGNNMVISEMFCSLCSLNPRWLSTQSSWMFIRTVMAWSWCLTSPNSGKESAIPSVFFPTFHIHSLQTPHSFSITLSCPSTTPFPPLPPLFLVWQLSVVRIRWRNLGVGLQRVIERLFHSRVEATVRNKERNETNTCSSVSLKGSDSVYLSTHWICLAFWQWVFTFWPKHSITGARCLQTYGLCFIDRAEFFA